MKKAAAVLFAIVVLGALAAGDTSKPVYKTTRLSLNDVAVSCKTGKPPLVDTKTDGSYVVITCE